VACIIKKNSSCLGDVLMNSHESPSKGGSSRCDGAHYNYIMQEREPAGDLARSVPGPAAGSRTRDQVGEEKGQPGIYHYYERTDAHLEIYRPILSAAAARRCVIEISRRTLSDSIDRCERWRTMPDKCKRSRVSLRAYVSITYAKV